MENEIQFPNKQNEALAAYMHEPEEGNGSGIVLGHCFTCTRHIGIIRKCCDALAKKGFLVLRFDFSGNGDSEGKFEDAVYTKQRDDMRCAIDFIEQQGVKKIGVLGHSMGGAVAIIESGNDKRVHSLCVLASPSSTDSILTIFSEEETKKIIEEGSAMVPIAGRTLLVKKEFFDDVKNHSVKESLSNFNNPFCVIHGDNDKVIPVGNAEKLFSYAKEEKEKHIIEGADHMFLSHADEAVKRVTDWFNKTLLS